MVERILICFGYGFCIIESVHEPVVRGHSITCLAVHAASAHEAGCGGSFHGRHHRRLQLDGAVRSAPPHAAPRSATVKREDCMPAALAMATTACSQQEESFPQLIPPQQEDVASFDTVFLSGQGRGKKLVTEEPKPVGPSEIIYSSFYY